MITTSLSSMGISQIFLIMAIRVPLNIFFGGISSIQIVCYSNLFNIQHPANSHHFYRIIASVINFDVFDPKWTTKFLLNFDFDEELGEFQSKMGKDAYLTQNMINNEIETFNPILNIGGLFCILVYSICLYLLYPCMYCAYKSQKPKESSLQ